MAFIINNPTIIEAAGNKPKIIREFIGRVNSKTDEVSIAKMTSPQGWIEPAQTPQFNEYTLVLKGTLQVNTKDSEFIVKENECIVTGSGEWIQYSTPFEGGAEYVAVCVPAFGPDIVNREE